MLGSITRACAQRGYDLLVSFQQQSGNWHVDYEDSRKADGIILLGYGDFLEYRLRLEQLVRQGTHFVRWGAVLEGQPGLSVGCDNFHGGQRSDSASARPRPPQDRVPRQCLGSLSGIPRALSRLQRGARRLRARRVSAALQVDAITMEQSGYEAACELLARGEPFDAIVAASDLIAIGALRALQERRIDVPGAVSVVGFDDIPAASLANPPLTTVMQDTRLAGEALVDSLLRSVQGEPAENKVLPTRLVVRRSCGG